LIIFLTKKFLFFSLVLSKFELINIIYPLCIFLDLANNLINTKQINGTIYGKSVGALFIPALFSQARQSWIENFFSQNNYIEYSALLKSYISEPKRYMQKNFEGICLGTIFISRALIDLLDAEVAEAINGETWVDAMVTLLLFLCVIMHYDEKDVYLFLGG
jgi:hypothetical protein